MYQDSKATRETERQPQKMKRVTTCEVACKLANWKLNLSLTAD